MVRITPLERYSDRIRLGPIPVVLVADDIRLSQAGAWMGRYKPGAIFPSLPPLNESTKGLSETR